MAHTLNTQEFTTSNTFIVPRGTDRLEISVGEGAPGLQGYARVTWWQLDNDEISTDDHLTIADMFKRAARAQFPEYAEQMIAVLNKQWKDLYK